jgi:hypothetical protein
VVLPLPVVTPEGDLNAPFSGDTYKIGQVLDLLGEEQIICAGFVPAWLHQQAREHGLMLNDYFAREELAVLNAVPTAEGVLQIALEELPITVHEARVLVIGFGRTGRLFGCEHTGICPDIMAIGKGMGNGFPVSGLVSTDTITDSEPFSLPSASSSSYGGNPLASAACLAPIQTIVEQSLAENAVTVGGRLVEGLQRLQERHGFVGDVRGRGLLIGVELVKDRRTKEPLDRNVCRRIFLEVLKRGMVSMSYKPYFRINPPLILSCEEADSGVAILGEVFDFVERHIRYKQ